MARPRRRVRGLTLIEIAIAIAIIGIVAAMAGPAFTERIARQRLITTAEMLSLDLAEARFEAARAGQDIHLVYEGSGPQWCYAVARSADCGCAGAAAACQLKVVRSTDAPGVQLLAAQNTRFEGSGVPPAASAVRLGGVQGTQQVQVDLSPLGRPRVCTTTGLRGYPAC